MIRTRSGLLVAVAALALGAGACKKKEDKAAGTAAGSSAAPGAATAKAGEPAAVAMGDDLSLLPATSDLVIGLNFAQLQQSGLWKQYAPKFLEKGASSLNDFKAACGFDPIEAIKTVSAGVKAVGSGADGVIVVHGPDKAKVTACLPKAKEEAAKNGTEITIDGDTFLVKDKGGHMMAWSFANDSTMVGTIGPSASKDALAAAMKGGAGLNTSDVFKDMYGKINTKDSLWFLVNGNASFMQQASAMAGAKPKAVFGSFNLTDGLTVDVRVRFGSPDEATAFVKMAQSQTGSQQAKQMFDKIDVAGDGADAKIAMAMSQQKLQQLIGLFGGLAAGMMGGAGGGAGGMGGGMGGP